MLFLLKKPPCSNLIMKRNQLHASLYELLQVAEYHFKFLYNIWQYSPPQLPSFVNNDNLILNFFTDSPFRNILLHYQNLLNNPYTERLEFYTDGSLIDLGTTTCSMAYACIHTTYNAPPFEFSSRIEHWPSSTRAEVAAILLTLFLCPVGINVTIYTDSQASIDSYNYLRALDFPFTARQTFKITSNNNLWTTLFTILHYNQLDLTLVKVKAHANHPYNNRADQVARDAHTSDYITEFVDNNNFCLNYIPLWNGIRIEKNPRQFLTDLSWNKGFEQFYNLYRNHKYRTNNIDWQLTFSHLCDDESSTITSFSNSRKKAHRIKFLTEELPTIEHMKKRRYDLYEFSKCPCVIIVLNPLTIFYMQQTKRHCRRHSTKISKIIIAIN